MLKNIDYINIIYLSNDWDKYHRKAFTENLIKSLSLWSDVILLQLPISLFVHIFSNFKKKIIGFLKGNYKQSFIESKTILFTPVILFHYLLWKNKFVFFIDYYFLSFQLNRFIKKNYGTKKIIIWYYFPLLLNLVKKSNAILKIYDQYDIYHMDVNENIDNKLEAMNNELIKISDVVFCTTEFLYDLSIKYNKNSFYITNGNNYEFLSDNIKEKASIILPIKGAKTIGYLGGIRDWIDFELLDYVIKKMSNVNFMFIGIIYESARKNMKKILNYSNVIWIDFVQPDQLLPYLSHFNAGIIPFRTNKFFKSVFPNKFFEYLALKIPVITTNLPELKKYGKYIGYSYDKESFLKNCEIALNGFFDEYKNQYSKIAKDNSWTRKTEEISFIVKQFISTS